MSAQATTQRAPLVSVVLSFRNEEEVLPELIRRLQSVFGSLALEYDLIFVNDASTDNSLSLLTEKAGADRRIKIVNMSRRFGVAECILAGMKYARGAAVVMMDADLQDPPEVIPQLVEKWQAGADVAYTVRTERAGESAFKKWLTRSAYKAIRLVANENLPVEAGDFKLISRRVVDELLKLNEKDPYLRGLVTWMGFKQVPVFYKREPRFKGRTHFPVLGSKGPILTFVTGFTSFSMLPLLTFLVLGILVTLVSIVAGAAIGLMKLLAMTTPANALLIAAIGFLSGVQLMGIGTLGLYLGRVYNDVRNRPRYLVESTIGFEDAPRSPEA